MERRLKELKEGERAGRKGREEGGGVWVHNTVGMWIRKKIR